MSYDVTVVVPVDGMGNFLSWKSWAAGAVKREQEVGDSVKQLFSLVAFISRGVVVALQLLLRVACCIHHLFVLRSKR